MSTGLEDISTTTESVIECVGRGKQGWINYSGFLDPSSNNYHINRQMHRVSFRVLSLTLSYLLYYNNIFAILNGISRLIWDNYK